MITKEDVHSGKVSEIIAYGKAWKVGKINDLIVGNSPYRIIMQEYDVNKVIYIPSDVTGEFLNSKSLNGTKLLTGALVSYATAPHYIPYDTIDELIPHIGKPLQYKLTPKDSFDIVIITAVDRKNKYVKFNGQMGNLKCLFETFVFLDGTPVGKLAPVDSTNEYEFQAKHSQREHFEKITITDDRIDLKSCGYISFDRIRGITRDCCNVNIKTCMQGSDKCGNTKFMEDWIVDHLLEFETCDLANSFISKLTYRKKEKYRPEHINW